MSWTKEIRAKVFGVDSILRDTAAEERAVFYTGYLEGISNKRVGDRASEGGGV